MTDREPQEFDVDLTSDERTMLGALSNVHGVLCRHRDRTGAAIVEKTRREIARIIGERNNFRQIAEMNSETIKRMATGQNEGPHCPTCGCEPKVIS